MHSVFAFRIWVIRTLGLTHSLALLLTLHSTTGTCTLYSVRLKKTLCNDVSRDAPRVSKPLSARRARLLRYPACGPYGLLCAGLSCHRGNESTVRYLGYLVIVIGETAKSGIREGGKDEFPWRNRNAAGARRSERAYGSSRWLGFFPLQKSKGRVVLDRQEPLLLGESV